MKFYLCTTFYKPFRPIVATLIYLHRFHSLTSTTPFSIPSSSKSSSSTLSFHHCPGRPLGLFMLGSVTCPIIFFSLWSLHVSNAFESTTFWKRHFHRVAPPYRSLISRSAPIPYSPSSFDSYITMHMYIKIFFSPFKYKYGPIITPLKKIQLRRINNNNNSSISDGLCALNTRVLLRYTIDM